MNPNTKNMHTATIEGTLAVTVGADASHRFLTPGEAAHRLGINVAQLTRLRAASGGPDWVLINCTVRYSLADLQWWRTHANTSYR